MLKCSQRDKGKLGNQGHGDSGGEGEGEEFEVHREPYLRSLQC